MSGHARRGIVAALVLAVGGIGGRIGGGGAAAAQVNPDISGLWRLDAASSYVRGCFDPCLCPVSFQDDLRGQFGLRLLAVGDVFDFYAVDGMVLRLPQLGWVYEGGGQFRFSQIAAIEIMQVTLSSVADPTQDYTAEGPVPANPDTMSLTLSHNNMVCFDTVFHLVARRCRADWDRDGALTPADVAVFVSAWVRSLHENRLDGDFDGNGAVQPVDVAVMVSAWTSAINGGPCL
jgi:hypothetical protein